MTATVPVPFVDLARQFRAIEADLTEIFLRVGRSGVYVMGPELTAFEERAAAYCDTRYAIGVGNATDALVMALRAMGIGPGDEVLTPANSFIASAGSIGLTGAVPRFVDAADDLNIDCDQIEQAITPRTKAIMPVHLTGRPANMDRINDIARRRGLRVIEDAAQAIGATYKGRKVGSLGDIACFSMHPLKNLHVYGDGGFITTNDKALYDKILLMRNHGLMDRNTCAEWGGNSRLDSIQAAIAHYKLARIDQWNDQFRAIAARYQEALADVVRVPRDTSDEHAVYHRFVVMAERRDELMAHLAALGIGSAIHYPIPLHLQPAAKALGHRPGDFPRSEWIVAHQISLPTYPEMTESEVNSVIQAVRNFYAK
jgi:dTDP-4-amino-4,6-dideoxygalactose transaminase